jgi:hypothetical protein
MEIRDPRLLTPEDVRTHWEKQAWSGHPNSPPPAHSMPASPLRPPSPGVPLMVPAMYPSPPRATPASQHSFFVPMQQQQPQPCLHVLWMPQQIPQLLGFPHTAPYGMLPTLMPTTMALTRA